jgi:mannosyltransferase
MIKTHRLPPLSAATGVLLILIGLLVPASALIASLRTIPADLSDQLLFGAVLFKVSLIILGLVVIILGRLTIWYVAPQSDKMLNAPSERRNLVILILILLSSVALRLYGLDAGLWHDEILAYVQYAPLPFGEIITTYKDQNQHFLFTLLAHLTFDIFGASAWSLRLPSVLFGVGSIWALYLFGRQVTSAREALLASALLTFSYHHIWFSQNGRGYAGLLFWALLTSWLFLRGFNEARRPQIWLIYALTVALGIYTNTALIFVVIGHFICYLITLITRRAEIWPQRWAGFFLGFCLAAFLTFLLHSLALPQVLAGLHGEESTVPAWKSPLWAFFEFVKAMQIGFAGGLIATIALGVFGAGFLSYARTKPVVIQLFIIPVALCAAVVIGLGHHLWPRLFIFAMGFAALVTIRGVILLGQAIAKLVNQPALKPAWLGTTFCIGLILVSALSIPPAYQPKQDFQGALTLVETEREPGDAVVTVGLATFTYKNFYKTDWTEAKTLAALNTIRAHAKRTWLVYTFAPEVQSVYPEIMASIQRDFKVRQQFYSTVGSGAIFVCLAETPPSDASAANAGIDSVK